MTRRPETMPTPVMTPAEGAPPHSWYMPHAAHRPSSKNASPPSTNFAMRSRAVSRPFSCWRATAFGPPPWRMRSSSARRSAVGIGMTRLAARRGRALTPSARPRLAAKRGSGLEGPVLPLAGRRDLQRLAVLGHRPPGYVQPGLLEPLDDLLVGEGLRLVFLGDDLQELLLDRLPGDALPGLLVGGAAAEEPLEREDAPRRLHPLVVHRPADGRHADADLLGDVLHLQGLDVLRPLVQERPLVVDDRPGHPDEAVPPLLDGVDQPVGGAELLLQKLAGLRVVALVLGEFHVPL